MKNNKTIKVGNRVKVYVDNDSSYFGEVINIDYENWTATVLNDANDYWAEPTGNVLVVNKKKYDKSRK